MAALRFAFWSLVFGLAYTQAPLYYSNQTQYFLHGLAHAGHGDLAQDWLANTRDPTPLFSALVAVTAGHLHEWLFHVYYLLILGLYFHSLAGIFDVLAGDAGKQSRLCFLTLLVVVHAGLLRLASVRLTGVDYPWYFQAGVAGQYLLGFGLQPSAFGVFLLASIHARLRERPWSAIVWACLAGVIHGTYLLPAAFLVLAYMVLGARERGLLHALLMGCVALLCVLPAVIYNLVSFAPSSPEEFREAQALLAHLRIPHHAEISWWFDGIALAQVLWIVIAIVMSWGSKLFVIMLVAFLSGVVLSLVQLATGSDTLALLFPWRISAVLVPVSTAVIVARIVLWLRRPIEWCAAETLALACGIVLGMLMMAGLALPALDLAYPTDRAELPLLNHIKEYHRPGEVYLIPVDLPKRGSGARSSNFTPAPRPGSIHIAVNLQQFRLFTGAALFVDFKAIPYQDRDVLEWKRRIDWCRAFYGEPTKHVEELHREGITHVVVPKTRAEAFAGFDRVYEDDVYLLLRVR